MALTLTKVFLLISVLACIRTAVGKIEGAFTSTDGYACKWMEQPLKNTLCRNFRLKCHKKKTNLRYNCVYSANPHGCNAYNHGQAGFYAALAKEVEAASPTACSLAQLRIPKMCQGTNIPPFTSGACGSRERIIFKEIDINEY